MWRMSSSKFDVLLLVGGKSCHAKGENFHWERRTWIHTLSLFIVHCYQNVVYVMWYGICYVSVVAKVCHAEGKEEKQAVK